MAQSNSVPVPAADNVAGSQVGGANCQDCVFPAGSSQEPENKVQNTPGGTPLLCLPRVIALLSQKGGPGKTTTTVNVSAALVQAGYPCLVIDVDPQRAAGRCFGVDLSSHDSSVYALFRETRPLSEVIVRTASGVDLVPSHPDLIEMAFDMRPGGQFRLKSALDSWAERTGASDEQRYKFILIDCPPDLNVLSANALMAATDVVIPVQPEPLSLFTLEDVFAFVKDARRANRTLRIMGFVLNRVSAQRESHLRQTLAFLQGVPYPVLGHVRDSGYLARAPETGRTIFQLAPQSGAADDYRKLAEALNGRK